MSITREIYRVTAHHGGNPEQAATRLAQLIISRWMPNNAGGAPILMVPKMARALSQFFARQNDVRLEISTMGTTPEIREVA